MAQRNHRIDRFAQMSKQEEIIAKKRQEILEKQRTAQLAKAVAAAQSLAAQMKTMETLLPVTTPAAATEQDEHDEEHEKEPEEVLTTPQCSGTAEEEAGDALETENGDQTGVGVGKGRTGDDLTPKTLNSFTGKTGKITFSLKRQQLPQPNVEQPPPKVKNTFCNDGSFLENFKKILEKHEQPKPAPPIIVVPTSSEENNAIDSPSGENNSPQQPIEQVVSTIATSAAAAVIATSMAGSMTVANTAPNPLAFSLPGPPPPPPPFAFNPTLLAQGPPQMPMPAFFHGHHHHPHHLLHPAAVPPPPPPPPPQLPIALANLTPIYMQLGPTQLPPEAAAMHQLNAIPQPREFDLNAIPKPQINLEAIQIPNVTPSEQLGLLPELVTVNPPPPPPPPTQPEELPQQQQSQQQQPQLTTPPQVFSETCIQLPTCIENLIALVAENGEDYEDKIRLHRSELHPALWFLYDKSCEQYRSYRTQLLDYGRQRAERQREQQLNKEQQQQLSQQQQQPLPQQQQQQEDNNSNSAADKYDPESAMSADFDSDDEYMRGMMDRNRDNIKRRIECRNELSDEERREREEEAAALAADGEGNELLDQDDRDERETQRQRRKRERKSRWGEKEQLPSSSSTPTSFGNQNKPILSSITRSDPALLQYARLNYGSTQLSEDQWKQCEEHFKVNLLYQDMMRKRQEIDRLARGGKFKYEYDSDEDVDGGTWEHKLRTAEMEATHLWANALTKQSEGKHHIGDFLPPEELKKFMEQYEAKKSNRQPDLSDYKEYKLKEDNIGFQMLQKLGWKEGQGLGQDGAGIVDPVNKAPQRDGNQGLGVSSAAQPEDCDNEYDAYRKRMMLAYRFRPNPLNNPRRAYY
ncbi:SURP and G-patch domain-containing protein 1 isoform X1 [Drosophila sulfurigaster albostrigata]|uniref:SURP and G-patch domain-containing protein 1 isoform X1 n=1 Tax=Drosophila sulfurigaster albostrigata TaxID=89887 RepID=UPI002D218E0A|nr:SURP and G-patch domain-containing protein 1 isoform X1 [Drosophila sulfurigaster albostrigata]